MPDVGDASFDLTLIIVKTHAGENIKITVQGTRCTAKEFYLNKKWVQGFKVLGSEFKNSGLRNQAIKSAIWSRPL